MTVPSTDPSLITVPLPSEEELTRVIGKSYDSNKTLNVIKMLPVRMTCTRQWSDSSRRSFKRKA
jgi:hypothetical protein